LNNNLEEKAKEIRRLTVKAIGGLGVGHIGGALSIVDLLAVLYFDKMYLDAENPKMQGRDRLVLSKGHAGPALYAALAARGFFPVEWLDTLNRPETRLPSHCDMLRTPGIDMTAGSLAQGISCAVGIAKAAKICGGKETVYAIVGDGECQEGLVWEAAMAAAHFKLDNLIVFVDCNSMQIDGTTDEVMSLGDIAGKFKAFGFNVQEADGHNLSEIGESIDHCRAAQGKPHAIILHTIKGKGASFAENAGIGSHNMPVSAQQMIEALRELQ
jgi:transketolase